jgi:hypothetical protein
MLLPGFVSKDFEPAPFVRGCIRSIRFRVKVSTINTCNVSHSRRGWQIEFSGESVGLIENELPLALPGRCASIETPR